MWICTKRNQHTLGNHEDMTVIAAIGMAGAADINATDKVTGKHKKKHKSHIPKVVSNPDDKLK